MEKPTLGHGWKKQGFFKPKLEKAAELQMSLKWPQVCAGARERPPALRSLCTFLRTVHMCCHVLLSPNIVLMA